MCEECGETGHSANKCPIRPCNACGLRSHKLQTSYLCPEHVCTLCNGKELPKGHNHNICPRAECQTCKLFGHVAKDCVYANCLDVDVDWFNLLFTKSESTVHGYFAEASVQAISLRTDGIVRTVTSWDLLQIKFTLSANQLMEIKLASYSFNMSRVIEDDTIIMMIVKETIESTGGYRNNLLHVDQVVVGLLSAFQRQMGTQILRGRTRDRPPLHPARVCAADLRRRFYFVDELEHSNFDSD
jgi:hypothetical protein